jgi:Na+/H+ antiporter NhaD/arsenite permease-like protein
VVESAKPEVSISFLDYLRVGIPITIATLVVGSLWLAWVR